MMSTTYKVTNYISGEDLGTYEAETAMDALDVMALEAGYADHVTVCRVAPVEDGEIHVWNISEGEEVALLTSGHRSMARC